MGESSSGADGGREQAGERGVMVVAGLAVTEMVVGG